MYKLLAKLNKALLPSFTKQGLDPIKAKKWQKAIIAYRYFITFKSLD
ncbi:MULTISPECIES: SsrA-binding protein [unclassified Flavobacterium]|nr:MULTISPECIES: SsrA-binding protein [unclassified Flavobacterium]MQP52564.1 SsrA-binding protein [Flavobacterium sp. LMO9]MQP62634.1 SsrA-binding protein [Flavobacterium sp. LMO6]